MTQRALQDPEMDLLRNSNSLGSWQQDMRTSVFQPTTVHHWVQVSATASSEGPTLGIEAFIALGAFLIRLAQWRRIRAMRLISDGKDFLRQNTASHTCPTHTINDRLAKTLNVLPVSAMRPWSNIFVMKGDVGQGQRLWGS